MSSKNKVDRSSYLTDKVHVDFKKCKQLDKLTRLYSKMDIVKANRTCLYSCHPSSNKNVKMNVHGVLIITVTALGLAACSTTAKKSIPELGVLEKVENLEVYPETNSNSAQLVKFPNHCIIEFAATMDAGLANEKWQFKGNQLMSATSTIIAENGTSTGEAFDLYDPVKQDNFLALKSHFKKQNMAACD